MEKVTSNCLDETWILIWRLGREHQGPEIWWPENTSRKLLYKNKNSNILKKSSDLRREKTAGAAPADRETACGCGGKNMTNLKRHSKELHLVINVTLMLKSALLICCVTNCRQQMSSVINSHHFAPIPRATALKETRLNEGWSSHRWPQLLNVPG